MNKGEIRTVDARAASWTEEAWNKVNDKVKRTAERIGARFPHAVHGGQYVLERPHWWTAGFWPGLLWLLYRENRHEPFRQIAEQCERELDRVIFDYDTLDHDIGFMWMLTSLARYKLLGDQDARRRALLAATLLAGRYNPQGKFIRAWNPWHENQDNRGWAIIDSLMNLPLLFWASEETKDPRFFHIAKSHAETVLTHFVRGDGSVCHIFAFDPFTGEPVGPLGGQGYDETSAWSRGTAWAVYGFAHCYLPLCAGRQIPGRGEADRPFLPVALAGGRRSLLGFPPTGRGAASPGFIGRRHCRLRSFADRRPGAASLGGGLPEAAERILRSLYTHYGAWDDPGHEGLILGGTGHFPEGKNINVSLIYGDYFFVEGLSRLRGNKELFW